MKSFKFLIILLFLSINSFAQTSTGWQTIYESNIGKIDMMVTFNDPNAKKHMHQTGVYFRTNIPYSVHISVYCKEITSGYDNGKPRYNQQLQSTFFNKANNWRESDVLVSGDVKSFKGAYINYLEIDNQVLFRNGQEISQFYYSTNNSSSTNQNTQNSSNTSQNSTGSSGTSSMNRGGNIVTEGNSYNNIDSEKNQSYQQFKQNGEKLVKEQKFFEAKQEFQKSLQYSVNDSQIDYANKMIAFCDEYSKKNEKYDNVSKGLQTTSEILDKVFEKDKTNVFGNNQKDTSENLYKFNQEFEELKNGINQENDLLTIERKIRNYLNSIKINYQSEVNNDKNLFKQIYYANSSIIIEVNGKENQIELKFDKKYLNLGEKIYSDIKNPFLKTITTNKLFPYIIIYKVTPKNNSNKLSFNSSVELINKINKNDISIEEMSELIKNYFESFGYKSFKIDFSDKSLIQITYFGFHINLYTTNTNSIRVIEIVSKSSSTINEIIQKLENKNFVYSNSEDYYFLRYNFNNQNGLNTNEDIAKLLEKYNKIISDYSKDNNSINLESKLRALINEEPEILNVDKQFYITYSSVLTSNASKLYDEGKFSDAEKKIRESLKYDNDNVLTNQYLFNILIYKYNDKKIKDVKDIIKELNILIDKLTLIDKENISQYLEIKNKINK